MTIIDAGLHGQTALRTPHFTPTHRIRSDSALAELARLRGLDPGGAQVISLADYATLAEAAAR